MTAAFKDTKQRIHSRVPILCDLVIWLCLVATSRDESAAGLQKLEM